MYISYNDAVPCTLDLLIPNRFSVLRIILGVYILQTLFSLQITCFFK